MSTRMVTQTASPLPRYRSHKEVGALKISESREVHEDGSVSFAIADAGFAPYKVAREVVARWMPGAGDYIVVYPDGYVSVSPAKVVRGWLYAHLGLRPELKPTDLSQTRSRFLLVNVIAQRAHELRAGAIPRVPVSDFDKEVSTAMRELEAGVLKLRHPDGPR